jgi:hypothetical protein
MVRQRPAEMAAVDATDARHTARHGEREPMPTIVTRDDKPVSPVLADENAAFAWLLKHQPMSTEWAIKYEGYAIVDAPEGAEVGDDLTQQN